MTQTRDLIKKMADFFTGEEFYEKGEDARLELSPDDVRCMNEIIKACGNAISRQAVIDIIHRFFTEEVDKIPTKKTEDGEVYVIHKCQPLFEMNKAICKRIKTLPSASPTQNCVESALDALDCISRQDAIDAVKTRITYAKAIDRNGNEYNLFESENSELKKAIRNIENLPSVNPQEPCDDVISRQAVFEQINCWIGSGEYCYTNATDYLNKRIKALQAVNPQEPRYYPPCEDCHNKMNEIRKAYDKIQSAEPKTGQYEKHIDHTDCIWYGSDSGCPVTCSQYRDGWNDAMDYIFKNGKGYQPYRRDVCATRKER